MSSQIYFSKQLPKNKENIMNKKNNTKTRMRQIIQRSTRILIYSLMVLGILTGVIYLWALNSTETSVAARGILWGDADANDWQKFPSRTIQSGSEVVRFKENDQEWLHQARIDNIPFDTYLEETSTTALIVLHEGELLYEGYFNGSSHESKQASLSVTKSFVSTLVGIAIEEGLIGSLDDPITRYLPELLENDERFYQITIRHLITMSSGLRFDRDESNPFSDDFLTYYSPDLRKTGLESRIVEEPGLNFLYNDYNPILIGMILERVSGVSVSEYLETRLWIPMGAEGDATWDLDSKNSGFEKMTVGINARAMDFARFGWLFLNEGRNGDQQVVPPDWVSEATRLDIDSDPAANYQYFWWVDAEHDAFYAEGNFCQMIYVVPDADLVIVRNGTSCHGSYFLETFTSLAQAVEENMH